MKPEIPPSSRMDDNRPKNRLGGCLKIIGLIIVLMIILPYGAQFGYCRGWWLKSNPWAYYWWLCNCDHEFEQSLYPDNVEIVISACSDPQEAILSPNGRYMIVSLGRYDTYLLDLVTHHKIPWPHPILPGEVEDIGFWTNSFVLIRGPDTETSKTWKLMTVEDGTVINLTNLRALKQDENLNHLKVTSNTLAIFQKANRVLIREGHFLAIALDQDPGQHPKNNYAMYYPPEHLKQLETIFSENHVTYEKLVVCSFQSSSCPSHDGRFIATNWQIFTSDQQRLTELRDNPSFTWGIMLVGWAHDDSGVYLRFNPNSYIINGGGFVFPNLYRLPQPIVKLKVPEEYRQPEPAPEP